MRDRAAEYRANAAEMLKCAKMAGTEAERAEYHKLAKAWSMLAEGADVGIKPEEPCEDQDT
jgi:hypothetical protein